jgi:hypothetical protein
VKNYFAAPANFKKVPGSPVAYWASDNTITAFRDHYKVESFIETREGLTTADNERFVRFWYEVPIYNICFNCRSRSDAIETLQKWFPYVKGGDYRKWYGNIVHIVNWQNDGLEIKNNIDIKTGRIRSHNYNGEYAYLSGITWASISISTASVRAVPEGCMFDTKGPMGFCKSPGSDIIAMAVINSLVGDHFLKILSPTLDFKIEKMLAVPVPADREVRSALIANSIRAVEVAKADWDDCELSWEFHGHPLISRINSKPTIEEVLQELRQKYEARLKEVYHLENTNNECLIDEFGLQAELSPKVPEDQITLYRPNREEDIKRLISYAIGCMMGRYSLGKPGLIYAHSGNKGFDPSQYQTFPADEDGIIAMMETDWFSDDASNRLVEFISVAWPEEHLEENLTFIADSLGPNRNEQPRATIRRYLATGFYKHHLSMYKRRPIYWLFSSGKQRAFQCLVYLHRYHEGTLSRMRTEYVIPLQGKMAARLDQLADDITAASSTSHRKRLQKEQDTLRKQHTELQAFDEQLRHYADQRISLDLDNGVKVNYGKFGDLLAEIKAVTGGSLEEA